MSLQRTTMIGTHKVEEFYYDEDYIVYVDGKPTQDPWVVTLDKLRDKEAKKPELSLDLLKFEEGLMKKSEPILEIKPLSYAQLMRVEFFAPNRVPGMEAAYAYLEARKIKPPAWLPAAIVLMLLGIGVVYAVAK